MFLVVRLLPPFLIFFFFLPRHRLCDKFVNLKKNERRGNVVIKNFFLASFACFVQAQSQTTINGRMVVEAIKLKLSEITVKFSLVIHRRQRYCGDFNLLFVYLSWTHYVFLPLLFFKVLIFFCKTRKKGENFVCVFFCGW